MDRYLAVCEQLGEDPDPDRMPPEDSMFPLEVQQAFLVHSLLPDRWEGTSGYFLGKDLSALGTLLDVWEIEDRRTVTYFLNYIDAQNTTKHNEEVSRRQDRDMRQAKAK